MKSLTRRNFLSIPLGAVALQFDGDALAEQVVPRASEEAVDVNVQLSRWSCRRVQGDETLGLVKQLRRYGVREAWAGSLDSLLHKDISGVNLRLADECRAHGDGMLLPFGAVNPTLPDWEEDLRRCHEELKMPGIRLHPNYHGYRLDEPVFERLLTLVEERNLILQLAVGMEDPRTQLPFLRVGAVDLEPLSRLLPHFPQVRIILLNVNALQSSSLELLEALTRTGQVYCEISWLEGLGGVGRLAKSISLSRILFGSYAPIFYFEAAWLKMQESPLTQQQIRGILRENAKRVIG
ncbi:MAG: amidohydrolase family protein [Luteitalea sp.]|nr:amidohydrolase family protein [Luteitalea sp.]